MEMAISLRGGALGDSSFRLWSLMSPSSSLHKSHNVTPSSSSSPILPLIVSKFKTASRNKITCPAVQKSSTSTTATADNEAETKEEVKAAPKASPAAKKPPAKPLPQMMEEDVIPSLKAIFEAQEDLSDIELVFQDNKLEGSFIKKGCPHSFWAFFPTGNLTATSFPPVASMKRILKASGRRRRSRVGRGRVRAACVRWGVAAWGRAGEIERELELVMSAKRTLKNFARRRRSRVATSGGEI